MQLFVLTTHCTSQVHCRTCRNLQGGRKWRISQSEKYQLPAAPENAEHPVDFECPFGKEWVNTETLAAAKNAEGLSKTESEPITETTATEQSDAAPVNAPLRVAPTRSLQRDTGSRGDRKGGCGCGRG